MDKNPDKHDSNSARRSSFSFKHTFLFFKDKTPRAPRGEYKDKVTANFSLLLAQDLSIRDFKIISNDPKYSNSDDLIIEAKFEGDDFKQTIAVQLKYQHKAKPLTIKSFLSFDGKSSDFCLFKYFKETEKKKIPDDLSFVLFTDRTCTINQNYEKTDKKNKNEPNKDTHNKDPAVELEMFQPETCQPALIKFINSKTQSKAYQFKVLKYDDSPPNCLLPPRNKFEDFLKRVYLFPSQDDVKEIENKLKQQFQGESSYKLFLEFIENWSKGGKKLKLRKETIITKFMECLLWPYSVGPYKDIPGQEILFNKVFLKFDVAVFEKLELIIDGYDKKFIEAKKSKITSRAEKQFGLTKKTDVTRLLWHLNELPLIITKCPKEILNKVLNLPKKENCGRRLIVVGTIDEGFNNWKTLRNLSDFNGHDLEEYFKDKKINLQGKEWPLVEYVKDDKDLAMIFRTEEIVRLFLDEGPLFLGEKARALSFYINRLLQKPIIDWNVLKDTSASDMFVISCNGRKIELENQKENFEEREEITIFEDSCSAQEFQEICSKNENRNVHHFQITEKINLFWFATEGSSETLTKYLCQVADEVAIDSEIFNNFTNKINVLCADPGMGKSFLMEFLRQNCPKDLWAIFINIREHVKIFEDDCFDQVVDGIIEKKYRENDLTRKIVNLMRSKKKILFLWDGLDEVPEKFHDNILKSVNFISKKGYLQWVTSRNHLKNMLEQELHVFASNLIQLDEDHQRRYIKKRLNRNSKRENKIVAHLENPVHQDLLGTPLQLLILTEIYQKDDDASDFISLTDMFRKSVEMKFGTCSGKSSNALENVIIREQLKFKEELLPKYQISGVLACFGKKLLRKLKVSQECHRRFFENIKDQGDENGLIIRLMEDDTPLFVHQTYAEYFCALYLKENVNQLGNFLSEEVASDPKFQTIRYMLDILLADGSKSHLAAIYGNLEKLEETDFLRKDLLGRTPEVLACIYIYFGRYSILPQEKEANMYEVEFDAGKWNENDKIKPEEIKNKQFYNPNKFQTLDIFEYCAEIRSLYPLEVLLRLNNNEVNRNRIRKLEIFGKYNCTYILCCIRSGFSNLLRLVETIPQIEIKTFRTSSNNLLHFVAAFVSDNTMLVKLLPITNLDINARNSHGRTPLLEAIDDVYGKLDQEMIQTLIEYGAQVDACDFLGQTPLIMASHQGNTEIVRILVGMGANLDRQNNAGVTPILLAAQGGHKDIVNILIECGADVNTKNKYGDSLLLLATEMKFDWSIIHKLIEAGADVNAKDEYGNTPLLMLKYYGCSEITKKLILENRNVDIDNENFKLEPLLLRASQKGDTGLVDALIKKETDVNAKTLRGETSLLLASKHGHIKIVELLLQATVDIDAQDENGDSPLLVAVKERYYDIVKTLIKKKPDSNIVNKEGDTPLLITCRNFFTNRTELVTMLIEAGANVNAQNKYSNSPLILAITQKDLHLAKILIDAKSDVNARNKNGDTALMIISRNRLDDDNYFARFLINAKADVDARNSNDDTPLIAASKSNNKGIARYLIKARADVNARNKDGDTPLIITSRNHVGDDNYLSRLLIEAGAADDIARNKSDDTPLITAPKSDNKGSVEHPIEDRADARADVNAKNKDDNDIDRPLIGAANVQNINGNTALIQATADDGICPTLASVRENRDDMIRNTNVSVLSSKKIFQFLLHKHLLFKTRYWRLTLTMIILPIVLFSGIIYGRWKADSFRKIIVTTPISFKTNHENFLLSQLPGKIKLLYAPVHPVANKIIDAVQEKFQIPSEDIIGFHSKEPLLELYERNREEKPIAAVMFNCEDSHHLVYNLTVTDKYVNWRPNKLFIREDDTSFGTSNYVKMGFTALQMVIDYAFIEATMMRDLNATISMQRFPYPPHTKPSKSERTFTELLPLMTILSFLLVYPTILYGIVDEKSSGLKELLKLYGVKPTIMWTAWAFEAFVTNIFSIVAISVLLKLSWKDMPALIEHSNGYMLLILLFLYFIASLSLTFFVSTFFSGRGLGTTVGIMINIISYIIPKEVMENLESFGFSFSKFSKIVLGLLPNVSLYYGYSTVSSYEDEEVGIQWKNCFMAGDDGGWSIGEVYLTLVCGTIIFTSGTIYMDILNHGKYGISQPLYFPFTNLIKFFKNRTAESSDVEKGLLTAEDNSDVEEGVAIKVKNLCKAYGQKKAVDDLSFSVKENSITILLGHNGAGKSTTISIITGVAEATSGSVKIKGLTVTNNLDEIRRNIGLCTQNNVLFNYLTVQEHLKLFGQLKGVKNISSRITVLLARFRLYNKKDALAGSLSGGTKRKLCLAIALVANPAILILDEPTSGMDVESRHSIWKHILKIRENTTIFMTTHFMEEANALADYVAIMKNGKLECFDTPLSLKRKYGEGYQLKLHRNNFANEQQVANLKVVAAQANGTLTLKDNLNNITINLPEENKHNFPLVFQELEEKNICGMDLSLITLTDVYLKIQRTEHQRNKFNFCGPRILPRNGTKGIIPLFFKRYFFLRRNFLRYLPRVLIALAMFLTAMFSFQTINQTRSHFPERAINLTLESYGMTEVYFGGSPQLSKTYEKIVQLDHSKPISSPNVTDAIIRKGVENLSYYKENIIAAAELDMKDDFISINAMYSSHSLHSAPISLNLAANTIAKFFLGENYSISITHAPLQKKTSLSELPEASVMISWLILVPCGMLILFNNFIIFPFEELSTGFVHIQKTSGLRLIYYWIVNVIFDMLLYIFKTAFFVVLPAIIIDFVFFNSMNYHLAEYGYLVCLFIVYAFSSLPFTYLFAYGRNLAKSCAQYTTASFLLGIIPATIVILLEIIEKPTIAKNLSIIFSIISPQYGLSYRCYNFANKYLKNFNWELMDINTKSYFCSVDPNPCCLDEASSACSNYKSYFHSESIEVILLLSLAPSLLYFTILLSLPNPTEWLKQCCYCRRMKEGSEGSSSILEALDIKKKYGPIEAVKGLTIRLKDSICYGLLGVNGAGKTTTFNMLAKNILPDAGSIRVRSNNKKKKWFYSWSSRYSRELGYCPQKDALNLRLSGKEVLLSVALLRGYSWRDSKEMAMNLLKAFDLERYADLECGHYSGGNKRKLSVCVALTGRPRAILLDEPTCGMDPISQRDFWEFLFILKENVPVILCSHSMEECEALCDEIAVMNDGKIEREGSISYLKNVKANGYTVVFQLNSASKDDIARFKEELSEFELFENEHQETIGYNIKNEKLSDLFKSAEKKKKDNDFIEDYVITSRPLQDILRAFAEAGSIEEG